MKTTNRSVLSFNLKIDRESTNNHTIKSLFDYFKSNSTKNVFIIENPNKGYKEAFIINDVSDNLIRVRFLRVRDDLWPQTIDFTTHLIDDLSLEDGKELIETSHFIISLDNKNDKLSKLLIEYNHYGSKVSDLSTILHYYGVKHLSYFAGITIYPESIKFDTLLQNLSEISQLKMTVNVNNINLIEDADFVDAMKQSAKLSDSKEIYIGWKVKEVEKTKSFLTKIFEANKKSNNKLIEDLKVQGKNNNLKRLEWLNLLECNTKFTVKPKIKSKRVLVSDDMFDKMKEKFIHN